MIFFFSSAIFSLQYVIVFIVKHLSLVLFTSLLNLRSTPVCTLPHVLSFFLAPLLWWGLVELPLKGCVENPISRSLTPIKSPICPRVGGIWGSEDLLGFLLGFLFHGLHAAGDLLGGMWHPRLTREHTHACSRAGFQCQSAGTKRPLCVWCAGKGSLMVCDQRVMSSCGVSLVFFVPDVKGHTQYAFVTQQLWLCLTRKWECGVWHSREVYKC